MKRQNCVGLMDHITDYIKKFVEIGMNRELSPMENNRMLFLCAQLYENPYLKSLNESIQLLINKNLEYIRKSPEQYLYNLPIGMFDCIGQYAFSVNTIEKKSGELKKLSYSLNQFLSEELLNMVLILKNSPVKFMSYDVISGPSGILSYLMRSDTDGVFIDLYQKVLTYLVWITEDCQYQQWVLPRFHVQREQQLLEYERNCMKNGQINFGMAHGMVGILEALTIAVENQIEVEGQKQAIDKIFNIYDRFEIYDNEILKFPRRLAVEDYFLGKVSDVSVNSGWCYGNAGIVRGLMVSAKRMGYTERYQHYQKELLKILNQPLEMYNLETSIICHGYASVLAIQLAAYRETKEQRFLNTFQRNFDAVASKFIDTDCDDMILETAIDFLEGTSGVILTLLDGLNHERNYLNYGEILLIE